MSPYTVIRDTREKEGKGWSFNASKYCAGSETSMLETGDYSLWGWEAFITIERKGSVSELAKNLVEPRFERELERMRSYPWRYILLEFPMEAIVDFPVGSDIPKRKQRYMKLRGPFLLKTIIELERKYDVPFVFCGTKGKEVCSSIFKRFMESKAVEDSNTV